MSTDLPTEQTLLMTPWYTRYFGIGTWWCLNQMSNPNTCPCLVAAQVHVQLLCTTSISFGTLQVTTAAGSVTADYSSVALLQPPIVGGVEPPVWNSTTSTVLTITGERCVAVPSLHRAVVDQEADTIRTVKALCASGAGLVFPRRPAAWLVCP